MEQENGNQNGQEEQFSEEEWQKQWVEAQQKAEILRQQELQKQEELKQSDKESGPNAMVLEGQAVELRDIDTLPIFSYEELSIYNGINDPKSYVAVCDIIFDTTGSGYYGPGEAYHLLAGHEGSVSLAKMSFESVFLNKYGILDLKKKELECLREWFDKFSYKYLRVGKLNPKTDDMITEQDKIDLEKIKTNRYDNPCNAQ